MIPGVVFVSVVRVVARNTELSEPARIVHACVLGVGLAVSAGVGDTSTVGRFDGAVTEIEGVLDGRVFGLWRCPVRSSGRYPSAGTTEHEDTTITTTVTTATSGRPVRTKRNLPCGVGSNATGFHFRLSA
jgi:hypothetical protein